MLATYYTGSKLALADGTKYSDHAYFLAAPSRFLGKRILINYKHKLMWLKCRDTGPRHSFDLSERAFHRLVGPNYRVIGVIRVQIERITK